MSIYNEKKIEGTGKKIAVSNFHFPGYNCKYKMKAPNIAIFGRNPKKEPNDATIVYDVYIYNLINSQKLVVNARLSNEQTEKLRKFVRNNSGYILPSKGKIKQLKDELTVPVKVGRYIYISHLI